VPDENRMKDQIDNDNGPPRKPRVRPEVVPFRTQELTPIKLAISFFEFVVLIAALMALTALSIDIMLPALPQIGADFSISNVNDQQAVVTCYLLGFAAGQLLYGPISDRVGRKPVLLGGLTIFIIGTVGALTVDGFGLLLAARGVQGIGAAAPRVVAIAVVRDLFSGRHMARVMSFVMMVFILVPVFAPAIGQALMHLGSWPPIFCVLLAVAAITMVWAGKRLPETRLLKAGNRAIALPTAVRTMLSTRQAVGYTISMGFMFGCLMSYIGSAEQIFVDVYKLGELFPIAFGAVASVMAIASFTNAQLVERIGMRRLSHSALVGFSLISLILCAVSLRGVPPLVFFGGLVAASFFLFGLIVPNFNAMAMQPLPQIAGTASSLIGFYSTAAGAGFGWAVGHFFNGTVLPLALGFAGLSLAALAATYLVEGRLFQPRERPSA
jgi:DHA1 family bicyclomycin/chloramphenicol resistance-like MFS transporter